LFLPLLLHVLHGVLPFGAVLGHVLPACCLEVDHAGAGVLLFDEVYHCVAVLVGALVGCMGCVFNKDRQVDHDGLHMQRQVQQGSSKRAAVQQRQDQQDSSGKKQQDSSKRAAG
jgi:hypothetical protein